MVSVSRQYLGNDLKEVREETMHMSERRMFHREKQYVQS